MGIGYGQGIHIMLHRNDEVIIWCAIVVDTPVRIRRPYQSKSTENTPNAALPGDEPDAAKEVWYQCALQ